MQLHILVAYNATADSFLVVLTAIAALSLRVLINISKENAVCWER